MNWIVILFFLTAALTQAGAALFAFQEPASQSVAPQDGEAVSPAPPAPAVPDSPAAETKTAPAPLPIDRQTYSVRVQVGFESCPTLSAEKRRSILEKLRDGLERYVGQSWDADVQEEEGELFSSPRALERLTLAGMHPDTFPVATHKAYLLALEPRGAGFVVSGREWDPLTRQLGPLLRGEVAYDRREIGDSLLALIHRLFRPLAVVEQARSKPPVLRGRAGDFPAPDPEWQPIAPESVFEVFFCYLTPEKTIDRIQQVPWTYLGVADDIDRGVAEATVTSGLRTALGARRRVQTLALGINGRGPATRLKMLTRPPSRQPLAGVEVEVEPASPPLSQGGPGGVGTESASDDDDAEKTAPPARPPKFVADRTGTVELSSALAPTGTPVWLVVRSGQALMARVPFVPGIHREEVLELGDDTLRLETEANIALLQAELVDTVARRAVLMSLARSRANANNWDAAAALLKEIDEMRKAPSFETELNAIRIPAIKSARAARDRTAELRIEKLCAETSELVTAYLDEEKLKELKDEIEEMRQAAADQASAEAKFKAADAGADPDTKKDKEGPEPSKSKKKKKKRAAPKTAPAPSF